jgi:phosphopantetheinyl transferase (holo-ACP synthase)
MELSILSARCEELSRYWGVQLIGEAHSEWGSDQVDHRQKIRQHLASLGFIDGFSAGNESHLQAKGKVDFFGDHGSAISISHAPGLGGFVAVKIPISDAVGFEARGFKRGGSARIGLDIEKSSRLSLRVIRRICPYEQSLNEKACFDLMPLLSGDFDESRLPATAWLAGIWTAKESAFKALRGPQQPRTISQVVLTHWKLESSHQFSFKFSYFSSSKQLDSSLSPIGIGRVWIDEAHAIALSLLR